MYTQGSDYYWKWSYMVIIKGINLVKGSWKEEWSSYSQLYQRDLKEKEKCQQLALTTELKHDKSDGDMRLEPNHYQ